MPLRFDQPTHLTPRERAEMDWEKEAAQLQVQLHEDKIAADLKVKQLEVKWTQVFRLPMGIILLPVKLVLALAIPISVITKQTLPKEYWEFLHG